MHIRLKSKTNKKLYFNCLNSNRTLLHYLLFYRNIPCWRLWSQTPKPSAHLNCGYWQWPTILLAWWRLAAVNQRWRWRWPWTRCPWRLWCTWTPGRCTKARRTWSSWSRSGRTPTGCTSGCKSGWPACASSCPGSAGNGSSRMAASRTRCWSGCWGRWPAEKSADPWPAGPCPRPASRSSGTKRSPACCAASGASRTCCSCS